MIIECSSCGAKYRYDETKLAGARSKKVKCPKCKNVIEVLNKNFPGLINNATDPEGSSSGRSSRDLEETAGSSSTSPSTVRVHRDSLRDTLVDDIEPSQAKLPDNRKLSLAVIQGSNAGEIYKINKAQVVIGRGNTDIVIEDLEASRSHARIDVLGDRIVLRDLNSTNGTFMDEAKINTATLESHSEFRIGTTVFMLIITDAD